MNEAKSGECMSGKRRTDRMQRSHSKLQLLEGHLYKGRDERLLHCIPAKKRERDLETFRKEKMMKN